MGGLDNVFFFLKATRYVGMMRHEVKLCGTTK